jgi:dipeptidyl aminopeptidase/acylaminoacyl peptidase
LRISAIRLHDYTICGDNNNRADAREPLKKFFSLARLSKFSDALTLLLFLLTITPVMYTKSISCWVSGHGLGLLTASHFNVQKTIKTGPQRGIFVLFWAILLTTSLHAQYKQPPADVTDVVLAKPTPNVTISPTGEAMVLVDYNPNPGIATLARPFLKLGGIRMDPQITARQRITEFTGCSILWVADQRSVPIQLPKTGVLSGVPRWSPDGKWVAYSVDVADGVQLWVADTKTGKSRQMGAIYVNEVLGSGFRWMPDSRRLLVMAVPAQRGAAPPATVVPTGPNIEETAGKVSQVVTLQDLLKSENDERLFEYYGQSQLGFMDATSGKFTAIGAPGLYMSASPSPDGQYLLTTQVKRPFSYRVAYSNFARNYDVIDLKGRKIKTIAEFGVSDEIPRQGVVTGPRSIEWQAGYDAQLVWVEALDGGDPKRKADYRDKLMRLNAPFAGEAAEVLKIKYRYSGLTWFAQRDRALLAEYDRDRRWVTTTLVDFTNPMRRDTMFDLSANDDYADPGNPVVEMNAKGEYTLIQEGDWIYLDAPGNSEEGQYPRLDRFNVKTKQKETLFKSKTGVFEEFYAFNGKNRDQILTRYESKTEVPNFFLTPLGGSGSRRQLTQFADPAPALTHINKHVVKYTRPDGVPLSGTLYLPTSYQPGQKLPLFLWAYPLEYSDIKTAGQVRVTDNRFTYYRNDSPLFFVTQGYAVLMDATIPIVGDPETMNNTFVEQATASGRAAIDYLDSLGMIDRKRVGVGGHSYGAFMTANLLAHSDDFAYGIARSGAYNRTLTPFGFQSERRTFWEARDIYMNVSPFNHAEKIKEPLLIIHGEADNNPGTFTIQSERLFQAIKGNGGTARLVLLPHESHGYRARESVLHVLAEMFEWANKYGAKP